MEATSYVSLVFMSMSRGFITTYSGLRFWPLEPDPEKVYVSDISHALSCQCRYGGHCDKFYSVAEHSVSVSRLCAPEDALWGLLHDASEAYLVDVPRPLKELPEFVAYRAAERRLQRIIAQRFGLPPEQPASVTTADDTLLWVEAHSLLGSIEEEFIRHEPIPLRMEIVKPLLPAEAEELFLVRYRELSGSHPNLSGE